MEHFEHNVNDHEDPIPTSTWLVGVVGTVLLIVIVFGLTALYHNAHMRESEAKLVAPTPFELERYRQQQSRQFVDEPTWTERDVVDHRVRALVIPIEDAMDQVIQEINAERRQRESRGNAERMNR